MIYKQCVLTIAQNTATLDEDIYLYRLDKNVELYFTIVNNKYKFDKSDLNNIINVTNASYFQVRLYKDDEIKYTFAIQPTEKGKAILTITDQLIDDPVEVGDYDFQISLLDADKSSMVSMPIAKQQLHICEPLVDNQAIMGKAVLGLSTLASGEIKNAFDSEGNYIREIHNDGDILSAQLVNKFEEALDTNSKNIKSQNNNIPHTISSKKLATVPANDIKLDDDITINNISINKDKRYYIEFLGSKKICTLVSSEEEGNIIMCNINNYKIEVLDASNNMIIFITKINKDINDVTFTDLIIYEEKVKYLDNKYLESDLILQNSISLGRVGNIVSGSSAIGYSVEASGICSHAEGNGTAASGNYSHSEGNSTTASGISSHAEGESTTASGQKSHAEGYGTTASGGSSHAEGSNTTASGNSSHAEGYGTTASSQNQHVQGKFNIVDIDNKYAHIVGNGSVNNRANAHTLDWNGNAWYAGDVQANNVPHVASEKVVLTVPAATISAKKTEIDKASMGAPVQINLNGTLTYDPTKTYYLKYNNKQYSGAYINDRFTIAENDCLCTFVSKDDKLMLMIATIDTTNITDMQLIEKDIKKLDNMYIPDDLRVNKSMSVGVRTGTIGRFSSSFGLGCAASGACSHSEGNGATASGACSHSEGANTVASGDYSHAEGDSTTASGYQSHAEGGYTTASGHDSHAEGSYTEASGGSSHAEGCYTIASSNYSHVQGQYNIEDTEGIYAHIVGNGSEDIRSNAHTLDWEGNAWFAGKLSQEGTPTEDKDLVTKKYVADKISSLPQLSFNESGELVVTINGVSKTFVPKDS